MHQCLFYSKPEELWALCRNQIANMSISTQWLYIADEHSPEHIQKHLEHTSSGQIIDSVETPFLASPVRIPIVIEDLSNRIIGQLETANSLLLFIEMSWSLRTPSGAVYLREFEAEIERISNQFPVKVICLYNQKIMLDRQLMIGIQTHHQLLGENGAVTNPHFVPHGIFSNRDLRGQFEHWLQHLIPSAVPSPSVSTTVNHRYNLEAEPQLIAQSLDEGRWKIRCFGGLRVYRANGASIQWNVVSGATRKTKTLFAFLLFRGDRGATAEEITDLLWPDAENPKQSLNRLYHTVRCLRKALSPHLEDSKQSPFVLREDQRYFLALPPNSWLDLPMFQELCYRGRGLMRQQNWEEAIICQESAKRLYTGDLLEDIPDKYAANRDIDWCWSQRYWYRQMYVKLLINSAEGHFHTNQISNALTICDEALQLDPVSEIAHQEKMRILTSVNRRDAAKRQYRMYKNALKQFNLGEPTSEFESFFSTLNL